MVEAADVRRVPGFPHPTTPHQPTKYSGVTNAAKTSILWQAGHPESWLCSIFANLTDDLAAALRDAWLASMILLSEANLMAERSTYNRMRRVVASVIDDVEVIALPSI
jgi:hypothetical protein